MSLLDHQYFYLIGIKGVAMTSMAQLLLDAGKTVAGSDVGEEFVTQGILNQLPLKIETNFNAPLPPETDCVIYTAAHHADQNPQVQQAQAKKLTVLSQAEAVAELFNQKQGIAVCGVGGKSTTAAMITWILTQLGHQPSFSVGVGNIPGLDKTGAWQIDSQYFVIEADEYVINPQAGDQATPRLSFLKPELIVCTNLAFDHPDVYRDFKQTQATFNGFFKQAQQLIINFADRNLVTSPHLTFGTAAAADITLSHCQAQRGSTQAEFNYQDQAYQLKLQIPGQYNVMNALAAILAVAQLGVKPQAAADTLATFSSTKRRFEFVGEKNGVKYYDDYAHHPHEIAAVVQTLNDWYPTQRKLVAFQPHTFSRTKELFNDFVWAFSQAQEVVMVDIFASAREKTDSTVSSDQLCRAIKAQFNIKATNLHSLEKLARYCQKQLQSDDVCLILGAGDIYQVHDLI